MSETQVVRGDSSWIPNRDEIEDLLDEVNSDNPDPKAVEQLRGLFKRIPDLWRLFGDVGNNVRYQIIKRMHGNKVDELATETGVELLRDELGHAGAPALECILIDHALTCWLRLQDVELRYGQVMQKSIALAQARWWEHRLSAAQRRFLRACETLARVRKLTRQTVALQVNIATDGGQQAIVQGDVSR